MNTKCTELDPVWSRIDEHRKDIDHLRMEVYSVKSNQAALNSSNDDIKKTLNRIEGEFMNALSELQISISKLNTRIAERDGAAKVLKWIIPIGITILIAVVGGAYMLGAKQ